jgi:hypothetical protein
VDDFELLMLRVELAQRFNDVLLNTQNVGLNVSGM